MARKRSKPPIPSVAKLYAETLAYREAAWRLHDEFVRYAGDHFTEGCSQHFAIQKYREARSGRTIDEVDLRVRKLERFVRSARSAPYTLTDDLRRLLEDIPPVDLS